MNLTEFKQLLTRCPSLSLKLLLPGGGEVPQSFHVTEVGHVRKNFVDCGGLIHEQNTVQIQAWVGRDADHRLPAGKLARILDLATRTVLPPDAASYPVEVEYENLEVTQFQITGSEEEEAAVVLHLSAKHTDCLAKDSCNSSSRSREGEPAAACCGGGCAG